MVKKSKNKHFVPLSKEHNKIRKMDPVKYAKFLAKKKEKFLKEVDKLAGRINN